MRCRACRARRYGRGLPGCVRRKIAALLYSEDSREQSNGVQVQVRVKLPSGPLIELSDFCKAIAEALRPTAVQHFEGIECIVGKMQRFRPPVQGHTGNGESAAEHAQVAPQAEGEHAPDPSSQDWHGTDVQATSVPVTESDAQQRIVELSEAPYRLTEDDRRTLSRLLSGLPSLRYPISDLDKTAFLDAWSSATGRPSWEPVLMTAADVDRYKFEQNEIQFRHQRALRDEFARGVFTAVDAGHAPVVALALGSFIPRESAITYLKRCGLVPDDGDVGVDTEPNDHTPEPMLAPAVMPHQIPAPKEKEPAASTKGGQYARAVDAKENNPDSANGRDNEGQSPQSTPGRATRKVGKVARLPRVIELTGLGRSSIYNRMDSRSPYYDPTFPRCFSLSANENGAVGWDEELVCAWVAAQASSA